MMGSTTLGEIRARLRELAALSEAERHLLSEAADSEKADDELFELLRSFLDALQKETKRKVRRSAKQRACGLEYMAVELNDEVE